MKTKNIFYFLFAAAVSLAMAGCSDKHVEDEQPPALEAISTATLGASGQISVTKTIDCDDPSLTDCHLRCETAAHHLTVTIGDDPSNKAIYVYNSSLQKWVPQTAGGGVCFPSFGSHKVTLRLCAMKTDPISEQTTGLEDALLHADVLSHTISSQVPVKELPSATLFHAHSLIEVNFDAALNADDITDVKINGTLAPYNVPSGLNKSSKYMIIVNPGDADAELTMKYKNIEYSATIEHKPGGTGTPFAQNTRYVVSMKMDAGKLVCGDMLVRSWAEAGGANVSGGATKFFIEGYAGRKLDVKIEGVDTPFAEALELDAQANGNLVFLQLADYNVNVEYVKYMTETITVNKPLGSTITILEDTDTGDMVTQP